MSQQNVEIVQRVYAPYAEGRLDFEFIDPEIEWRGPREFPDLGEAHHGHEGITRSYWERADALEAVELSEQDAYADSSESANA